MARWNPSDDAKLVNLWRTPHNKVDSTKLDVASVKAVHSKHFPSKKYVNFAPLYRNKAREFNVAQTLNGHRKRSAAAKAAQDGAVNLEDSSSEDDDEYESKEDLSEFEEEEEEEDEASVQATMGKQTPKKKTPSKAATADDITGAMGALSIRKAPMFSLDFVFPFLISVFNEGLNEICNVQLLVLTLPKSHFIPEVLNGTTLEVRVQSPPFFTHESRVKKGRGAEQGFNDNTHEVQGFKKVCEAIDNHFGLVDHKYGDKPQRIALPFICEERIVSWDLDAYKNKLVSTMFPTGNQFFGVLNVKLQRLKTKRRVEGGFKIIDSDDEEMGDGDGADA